MKKGKRGQSQLDVKKSPKGAASNSPVPSAGDKDKVISVQDLMKNNLNMASRRLSEKINK